MTGKNDGDEDISEYGDDYSEDEKYSEDEVEDANESGKHQPHVEEEAPASPVPVGPSRDRTPVLQVAHSHASPLVSPSGAGPQQSGDVDDEYDEYEEDEEEEVEKESGPSSGAGLGGREETTGKDQPAPLPQGGGGGPSGVEAELRRENAKLRAELKQFSAALDTALKAKEQKDRREPRRIMDPRDHEAARELARTERLLKAAKKENAHLRHKLQEVDFERVIELENKLHEQGLEVEKLKQEVRTLTRALRAEEGGRKGKGSTEGEIRRLTQEGRALKLQNRNLQQQLTVWERTAMQRADDGARLAAEVDRLKELCDGPAGVSSAEDTINKLKAELKDTNLKLQAMQRQSSIQERTFTSTRKKLKLELKTSRFELEELTKQLDTKTRLLAEKDKECRLAVVRAQEARRRPGPGGGGGRHMMVPHPVPHHPPHHQLQPINRRPAPNSAPEQRDSPFSKAGNQNSNFKNEEGDEGGGGKMGGSLNEAGSRGPGTEDLEVVWPSHQNDHHTNKPNTNALKEKDKGPTVGVQGAPLDQIPKETSLADKNISNDNYDGDDEVEGLGVTLSQDSEVKKDLRKAFEKEISSKDDPETRENEVRVTSQTGVSGSEAQNKPVPKRRGRDPSLSQTSKEDKGGEAIEHDIHQKSKSFEASPSLKEKKKVGLDNGKRTSKSLPNANQILEETPFKASDDEVVMGELSGDISDELENAQVDAKASVAIAVTVVDKENDSSPVEHAAPSSPKVELDEVHTDETTEEKENVLVNESQEALTPQVKI